MQWRNSQDRFGAAAKMLHWAMFVVIAAALVAALSIDAFPKDSPGQLGMQNTHETLGLTVLLLLLVRIAWRVANPTPPAVGPASMQTAARVAHFALYALMLAIPLVGYVVATARGHDPMFWGWSVPSFIGKDRALARSAKEIHELLAWTLVAVVALHAAAALWHHLVLKDGVLRRMWPGSGSVPAADTHRSVH